MNIHDSDRATGSRAWLLTTRGTEYMVALLVAQGVERNRSDLSVEEQDLLRIMKPSFKKNTRLIKCKALVISLALKYIQVCMYKAPQA